MPRLFAYLTDMVEAWRIFGRKANASVSCVQHWMSDGSTLCVFPSAAHRAAHRGLYSESHIYHDAVALEDPKFAKLIAHHSVYMLRGPDCLHVVSCTTPALGRQCSFIRFIYWCIHRFGLLSVCVAFDLCSSCWAFLSAWCRCWRRFCGGRASKLVQTRPQCRPTFNCQ